MKLRKILAILLLAAVVSSSASAAVSAAVDGDSFPYSVISADVDFEEHAYIGLPLDVAGQTVIIRDGLTQSADIHLHGGNLIIVGDYELAGGTLYLEGGSVTVSEDMNVYKGMLLAGYADDDESATDNGGSIVVSGSLRQTGGTVSGGNGLVSVQSDYTYSGGSLTAANGRINVAGDLTQTDKTVSGENGIIEIAGSYYQSGGRLSIGSGEVTVGGNYILASIATDDNGQQVYNNTSATLYMDNDAGHFTVCGDFTTKSWYGAGANYNYLAAGTLELKGDFTQLGGDSNNFRAEVAHKVKFTGEGRQTVSFEVPSSSRFGTIIEGSNTEVDIVSGNIATVSGSVTIESFNQYGDLDLNGNTLTVTGDVTQNGNISGNEGTMNVGGDWLHKGGTLDINGGTILIDRDYTIGNPTTDGEGNETISAVNATLKMNNEDDYMRVGGDFTINSRYGAGSNYNDLVAGTLELKGDFTQLGGDSNNFCAEVGHKVKFTGEGRQTVSFEVPTSSRFGTIIEGNNHVVDIVSGNIASVGEDVTIENFTQFGNLDLNGKTLTVTGNVTQNGNISGNAGTMNVGGDWLQKGGTLDINGGTILIEGNYTIGNPTTDGEGNETLSAVNATLKMNDEDDYMRVGGDFTTKSWYGAGENYNDLVAGTMELKGDFTQLGGDSNNFRAEAGHKVKFTGEGRQTVSFEVPSSSRFGTIIKGSNAEVNIVSGNIAYLGEDVTIESFCQYGTLDIAGHKLTVTSLITQNGNINVNSGTINAVGGWQQTAGCLDLNNGTVNIEGDYINAVVTEDENGNTVLNSSTGTLKMNNENDYMRVGGDMVLKSWYGAGSNYNDLTNGTLELCGNFTQINGDSNNFRAGKDHKVLFNGDGKQTVNFGNPESSRFGTLLTGDNAVVDIVSGNIAAIGEDAVIENFNQYGDLDVNGKTLTVTGNVTQNGNIYGNSGTMNVGGDWLHKGGTLDINGGTILIDGDYTIGNPTTDGEGNKTLSAVTATLKMNDEDDYMRVGGDFTTNSWYGKGTNYNHLTAGTLELKGDFTQLGGDSNNFCAEVGHKVKFTGEGRQTVSFEVPTSSRFGTIIEGSNHVVDIVSGNIASVGEDVTIENFTQFGNLDLNGKTLTVTGNVTQNGNISGNCGIAAVGGDWIQKGGTLDVSGGKIMIGGNYSIGTPKTDENGDHYLDKAAAVLKMNDEDDYMLVGGDFTTNSWYGKGSNYNHLVAGTLELKGDFTQLGGDASNFCADKDHKVIFSGEDWQAVYFENPSSSHFGTIAATPNNKVDITSGSTLFIGEDITLTSFVQYGSLDLAGNRLTVTDNLTQNGNININEGTAIVEGNWLQKNGTLDLNNGMIRIGGNYTLGNPRINDEGEETLDNAAAVLQMNDARDYMLVEGDFTTKSWYGKGSNYNYLANGVLEVKGDFSQLNGDGSNFSADFGHMTILSGEAGQTVTFQSRSGHFGQLAVCTINHDENFYNLPYNDYQFYSKIYNYNAAVGISTLSSNSVKRGETVDILARVTMAGTTCQYRVYASIDGGADELIGAYIGPNFGITYTPPRAGEYSFKVHALTSEGKLVEQTLALTVNPAYELKTGASLSSSEITEGEIVKINTNVKGGVAPYTYSYAYRAAGSESWTAINGSDSSAQFTPAAAGDHEIRVTVTDVDNTKAETILSLKVNPDTSAVINNSTINSTALTVGSRLTISGAAEGGDGNYTYTYSYKRTTSRVWSTIGSEDTSSTIAVMTPSSAGTFDIRVTAKDGAGKTAEKLFTLTVSDGKSQAFKNKSTISTTGAKPGTRIILNGAAEGSSGYRYAYYYKRTSARAWTILGEEFGTSAIGAFTPRTPGEFNLKIDVMDENGEIVSRMFALTISNDYVDTTMINNSKVSTSSALPGTRIVLTGAAEGGEGGYTYAYYYKKQNASNWTILGTEFGTSEVQGFTPRTLGNYIIKIAVKDSAGGMTSKNFDLEITNDPKPEEKELENTSTISATNVTAGTTVKVTGAAENGSAPYTYTYYYKKASALKWTEMTSADGSYAAIKLRNAGSYNFKTVVTDSEGKTAEKQFNVTVS